MASTVEAFLHFGAEYHSDIEAEDMHFQNCGLLLSGVVPSVDHVSSSTGRALR